MHCRVREVYRLLEAVEKTPYLTQIYVAAGMSSHRAKDMLAILNRLGIVRMHENSHALPRYIITLTPKGSHLLQLLREVYKILGGEEYLW